MGGGEPSASKGAAGAGAAMGPARPPASRAKLAATPGGRFEKSAASGTGLRLGNGGNGGAAEAPVPFKPSLRNAAGRGSGGA